MSGLIVFGIGASVWGVAMTLMYGLPALWRWAKVRRAEKAAESSVDRAAVDFVIELLNQRPGQWTDHFGDMQFADPGIMITQGYGGSISLSVSGASVRLTSADSRRLREAFEARREWQRAQQLHAFAVRARAVGERS